MLFNSFIFLVFGTLFFLIWKKGSFKQIKSRWLFLTIASLFFYGWWDWRYVFLFIATGLIDFYGGVWIEKYPAKRKMFLAMSLIANLGVLAFFKYLVFFSQNLNGVAAMLGVPLNLQLKQLVLPLGISFYTFESMSYVIDVYRGQLKPTKNILHYFAFLSLFPHLIAGPIIRPHELLPQLEVEQKTTSDDNWEGTRLIIHGFFKKMVIADNLAPMVNLAFSATVLPQSSAYWWIIISMFAFQIYCDFSGYSDIARGLARWMGYHFPMNFNHPYISQSFQEFWTRWHITLSSWFRDYVYIPLGGNGAHSQSIYAGVGGSEIKTDLSGSVKLDEAGMSDRQDIKKPDTSKGSVWVGLKNMWITMLISGLWHGASWNFVIWGGAHALYLSIERLTQWPKRLSALPLGKAIVSVLILIQVWVAWVFFRAETLPKALEIIGLMFNASLIGLSALTTIKKTSLLFLLIGISREYYMATQWDKSRFMQGAFAQSFEPIIMGYMLAACVFLRGSGNAFIYFQF